MVKQMKVTGGWLSKNILEVIIIGLVGLMLGQNISYHNKMEKKLEDYDFKMTIFELAIMNDPDTPQYLRDALAGRAKRSGIKIISKNGKEKD